MEAHREQTALRRFSAINRRGQVNYRPGWQKHHILPRQLVSRRCFRTMLGFIIPGGAWLDDFKSNGVLLPATEAVAIRERLPLHRGPHRIYNELVFERVGAIEKEWSHTRRRDENKAGAQALLRMRLIQRALARRLKGEGRQPLVLNRRDPIGHGIDFSHLDAMAERLWGATRPKR